MRCALDQETLNDFYRKVGARIRDGRLAKGETQDSLARQVALGRSSIANIESGHQKLLLHTFFEICHTLRLAPGSLLPSIQSASPNTDAEGELPEGLSPAEQAWIRAIAKGGEG